jgi:hypothetical protein
MLVLCMLVTLSCALSTGQDACLQLRPQKRPICFQLSGDESPGGAADVGTVLIDSDAPEKLVACVFSKASIRAVRTGLDTRETCVHALMNEVSFNSRLDGVAGDHLMGGWHGDASKSSWKN